VLRRNHAIKSAHLNLNYTKKTNSLTMEPTETSLMMGANELSILSQSYMPNLIRNAEDEDQSFDLKPQ